jgi:hypothetical protein
MFLPNTYVIGTTTSSSGTSTFVPRDIRLPLLHRLNAEYLPDIASRPAHFERFTAEGMLIFQEVSNSRGPGAARGLLRRIF